MTYFDRGLDGLNWYDDCFSFLEKHYQNDAATMAAILAATSINSTVKANVTLALKAYRQLKTGLEFTGFIPAAVDQLNLVKLGQSLTGVKVESFRRALLGDPDAVVVDRWMLRAYDEDNLSSGAIRRVNAHIKALAVARDVEPRQAQAAVWTGIKRVYEGHDSDTRSFVDLLAERLAQLELPL